MPQAPSDAYRIRTGVRKVVQSRGREASLALDGLDRGDAVTLPAAPKGVRLGATCLAELVAEVPVDKGTSERKQACLPGWHHCTGRASVSPLAIDRSKVQTNRRCVEGKVRHAGGGVQVLALWRQALVNAQEEQGRQRVGKSDALVRLLGTSVCHTFRYRLITSREVLLHLGIVEEQRSPNLACFDERVALPKPRQLLYSADGPLIAVFGKTAARDFRDSIQVLHLTHKNSINLALGRYPLSLLASERWNETRFSGGWPE